MNLRFFPCFLAICLAAAAAKGDCARLLAELGQPQDLPSEVDVRKVYVNTVRWLALEKSAIDAGSLEQMLQSETVADPLPYIVAESLTPEELGALRGPLGKLVERLRRADPRTWRSIKETLVQAIEQKKSQAEGRQDASRRTQFVYFASVLQAPPELEGSLFYTHTRAANGDYYFRGDSRKSEPILYNISRGEMHSLGPAKTRMLTTHLLHTGWTTYLTKADSNPGLDKFGVEAVNISDGAVTTWDVIKLMRSKKIKLPEVPISHVYLRQDGALDVAVVDRSPPGMKDKVYLALGDPKASAKPIEVPDLGSFKYLAGAPGEFFYLGMDNAKGRLVFRNLARPGSWSEQSFGEAWTAEPNIKMVTLGERRWIVIRFSESAYYFDTNELKVLPLTIGLGNTLVHYHEGKTYVAADYPGIERKTVVRELSSGRVKKFEFEKRKSSESKGDAKQFLSLRDGALFLAVATYTEEGLARIYFVDIRSGDIRSVDLRKLQLAEFYGVEETPDGRIVGYFCRRKENYPIAVQLFGPPPD